MKPGRLSVRLVVCGATCRCSRGDDKGPKETRSEELESYHGYYIMVSNFLTKIFNLGLLRSNRVSNRNT